MSNFLDLFGYQVLSEVTRNYCRVHSGSTTHPRERLLSVVIDAFFSLKPETQDDGQEEFMKLLNLQEDWKKLQVSSRMLQ